MLHISCSAAGCRLSLTPRQACAFCSCSSPQICVLPCCFEFPLHARWVAFFFFLPLGFKMYVRLLSRYLYNLDFSRCTQSTRCRTFHMISFYDQKVCTDCRDRLVVRTLRCGRSNPGSNPGHGSFFLVKLTFIFIVFVYETAPHVWKITKTFQCAKLKGKWA